MIDVNSFFVDITVIARIRVHMSAMRASSSPDNLPIRRDIACFIIEMLIEMFYHAVDLDLGGSSRIAIVGEKRRWKARKYHSNARNDYSRNDYDHTNSRTARRFIYYLFI